MPIRPARRAECDLFAAIERAAAAQFRAVGLDLVAEGAVSDPAFIRACLSDGVVLVATDRADAPVGFALAGQLDRCLHLYELDVHPDHAGQGHGGALLAGLAAAARERGLAGVTLSTFADVPWNAPFYAKRGFAVVETVAWTPALHLLRQAEAALGLPIERRVFMRQDLRPHFAVASRYGLV